MHSKSLFNRLEAAVLTVLATSLALTPISCGETNKDLEVTVGSHQLMQDLNKIKEPEPQLPRQSFAAQSSVYSICGAIETGNQDVKVYHFGAVVSDQTDLEDHIAINDLRNNRVIAFDLFAGDQADLVAAVYEPTVVGGYNLSPGAKQDRHSRWGKGTVKNFDSTCETTVVDIVSGTVSIQPSLEKLLSQYQLQYRLVLANGEVLEGKNDLAKIQPPSHLQAFTDLQCSVPSKDKSDDLKLEE